jgi:hypothetical protein
VGSAEAETILADLGAAGMLRAISLLASSEARAPRR